MTKKKKESIELALIRVENEAKPKKESKLKLKCKKLYAKTKELFIKSKPIIKFTNIYLETSAVMRLIFDIWMIYTFGNAGVVYYITS